MSNQETAYRLLLRTLTREQLTKECEDTDKLIDAALAKLENEK